MENAVGLTVENDYVTRIDGDSFDAELMREYFAAWGERDAYAVSHVGWGMNTRAHEVAGRHTLGHFDLPLRHCTIELDGKAVVRDGKLAA